MPSARSRGGQTPYPGSDFEHPPQPNSKDLLVLLEEGGKHEGCRVADPVDTFAANLKALRHERALTQEALAEAAEMDAAEIRRLEAGKRDPGLRVISRLARGLDVPLVQLLRDVA